MSPRLLSGPLGAAPLPRRAAPPELVRRPRVALLIGQAPLPPATGGRADAGASLPPLDVLAGRLATALPAGWRVLVAVHGGRPTIADALDEVEAAAVDDLVVVPPFPCFSQAVTGEIARHLYSLLSMRAHAPINLAFRGCWYDDVGYVSAQAAAITEFASGHDLTPANCRLLFSARAPLHASFADCDPYRRQVGRSARLIAERLGWPASRTSLAWHGGSDCRTESGPDTSTRLGELLVDAATGVLLCPLAGPDDGGTTEGGDNRVYLCPPLAAQERYAAVLRDLVLRGVRPVQVCRPAAAPSAPQNAAPADHDPAALLMVGVAAASGQEPACHEPLRYSDSDALLEVKRTRPALRAFLRRALGDPSLAEAFVWDTCQRIECYGWLADPDDRAGRERIAQTLRRQLFDGAPDALAVNVLAAADAWRHLMRTACGLHSRVPGDSDVLQQLQTARHIAESAGAAGGRTAALVADATHLAERVCAETGWGAFRTGYCQAALACVPALRPPRAAEGRHLVIGGSATSRSVLTALRERFAVPAHQLTLVYRDHHGQMKMLRTALGHGRRLRVHAYGEASVLRAIGDADFVYVGIDQPQPILDPPRLRELRDLAARPLTIVDFNSYGSFGHAPAPDGVTLWSAKALDEAVAAQAAVCRGRAGFAEAVAEAEQWIERHAPRMALPAGAST